MVCNRCKMVVRSVFEKLGLQVVHTGLGEVEIAETRLDKEQLSGLSAELKTVGFELIDNKQSKLIEQIKTIIIDSVHHNDDPPKEKYSELLSRHLHYDYSYLSHLFSQVEGITIELYIISQKIEKVKEMLVYDELSLSQIAFQMGYSSTAHLSSQFKKQTGVTPSQFRQMRLQGRKGLDEIGKPK